VATLITNGELAGKYESSVFCGLVEPDELEPLTIHKASLDVDATEQKPGLQA
jgi:hypothetical protein